MQDNNNNTLNDLLSNLPDEIMASIVSFLPNESALETSFLSTRWRDLWNVVLFKHRTAEDATGNVTGFLSRFEAREPLKHPRKLQFRFSGESAVFATIASDSKLFLDFSPWKKKKELQVRFQYQLQLKLNEENRIYTHRSLSPSALLVKTLYLKSMSYLTSEVASSIVSNMEHLEKLVITECIRLKCLSVESKSELRKLPILDCLGLESLHLRTSKLRSFHFRGPLPLIRPEYHFNLSDATLDFRLGPSCSDFKCKDFDATLLTIKNSEVLTLCEWTFGL